MTINEVLIHSIKPYENNPRKNDQAINAVAESIKQYGFQQPIVVDKNNVIIVGHTRYEASKVLGLKTVPVVVADNLDEKQVRAYRIADNKTSDFSIWDNKKLLEELEACEDLFTGFTISNTELSEMLNETDKSAVENDEYGISYEITFRSEQKEKIEKVKKMWEEIAHEG